MPQSETTPVAAPESSPLTLASLGLRAHLVGYACPHNPTALHTDADGKPATAPLGDDYEQLLAAAEALLRQILRLGGRGEASSPARSSSHGLPPEGPCRS